MDMLQNKANRFTSMAAKFVVDNKLPGL